MARIESRNDDFSKPTVDILPQEQTNAGFKTQAKAIRGIKTFFQDVFNGINGLVPIRFDQPPNGNSELLQVTKENGLAIAENIQKEFDEQSKVTINGRELPGIFQGIDMIFGSRLERFDKQRTDLEIDGERVSDSIRLFQVDKGDEPVRGRANFLMLDDIHSSAREKAQDFVRIITNDDGGIVKGKDKIPRVFIMETYLNGKDWDGPLNFTRVKIKNGRLGLPVTGQVGSIPMNFVFEQFEILDDENRKVLPETPDRTGEGKETETEDQGEGPVAEFIPTIGI